MARLALGPRGRPTIITLLNGQCQANSQWLILIDQCIYKTPSEEICFFVLFCFVFFCFVFVVNGNWHRNSPLSLTSFQRLRHHFTRGFRAGDSMVTRIWCVFWTQQVNWIYECIAVQTAETRLSEVSSRMWALDPTSNWRAVAIW